jgi:short-subunit dehydrogenase
MAWRHREKPSESFYGQGALVTGASGGLGTAIVRALAGQGAHVLAAGRRGDSLENLARATNAEVLICDLADRNQLLELARRASEVDILVSNGGVPASGRLDELSVEQIDRAIDVNLRAPLLLAREASAAMALRGHGHLVIMSSISGKLVGGAQAVYGATKAGLRAAAVALREDLHGTGVTVSVILPGPVSGAGMWADSGLPLPRGLKASTPDDVATAVVNAMLKDRFEVDVCSWKLRTRATIALIRPTWTAAKGREGSKEFAEMMTAAHSTKW